MSTDNLQCWNCGADLSKAPRPISRHETCPACFEALHCCRLCEHFRAAEPAQCAEDRADPPVNKENANFCEWFQPNGNAFRGESAGAKSAKGKLDALFGADEPASRTAAGSDACETGDQESEGPVSREAAAKAELDALFRKQ